MGKGKIVPMNPDNPIFKRGIIVTPVPRSRPSSSDSESGMDGANPMQPAADAIEDWLDSLKSRASSGQDAGGEPRKDG